MSDPVRDAAKQMDDWVARQQSEGFTGSVRMMGQTGDTISPVFERPVGMVKHTEGRFLTARLEPQTDEVDELAIAAKRWLSAKIDFENAQLELIQTIRKREGS